MPITIGGVVIEAGDLIVGDGDGVVVVPRARIDEALAELAEVRKKEAAMDAAVRGGLRLPDWVRWHPTWPMPSAGFRPTAQPGSRPWAMRK